MTNSNKLVNNNAINPDLSQMSVKRNLMLGSNQLCDSHIRSLDNEDLKDNMEDMIDSEKEDTNDDSETDSGSASDGEESSGMHSFDKHFI